MGNHGRPKLSGGVRGIAPVPHAGDRLHQLFPQTLPSAADRHILVSTVATKISTSSTNELELLTAQEFLDWLKPGRHADLIDGEIEVHSPVSTRHADLLNFLDGLLRIYIDRHDLGFLYREVVAVRLSSRNVFMPDLAFYKKERADLIAENHVNGAPDLVAEALSPRTAHRDAGPKFAEYEQHGVTEYWVLDPETLAHRFYRREGDELVEYAAGQETIDSAVVQGFFVRRSWLDPAKLPKIETALSELK